MTSQLVVLGSSIFKNYICYHNIDGSDILKRRKRIIIEMYRTIKLLQHVPSHEKLLTKNFHKRIRSISVTNTPNIAVEHFFLNKSLFVTDNLKFECNIMDTILKNDSLYCTVLYCTGIHYNEVEDVGSLDRLFIDISCTIAIYIIYNEYAVAFIIYFIKMKTGEKNILI